MDWNSSVSVDISRAIEVMPFTLPETRLDLWFTWPDRIDDEAELAYCTSIVTEEERRRIRRFVLSRDRHIRLVTWASARAVLGRYLGLAPRDLRFEHNTVGKPDLIASQRAAFNISHMSSLILLGVTCDRAIGVDVESLECGGLLSFIDRFMTEAELPAAGRLGEVAQHKRHLEIWTLKEAYSEARSIGLSLPTCEGALNIVDWSADQSQVFFSTTGSLVGEAGRWEFKHFALEDRYVEVVCSAIREDVSPSVTAASVSLLLQYIMPMKLEGLGAGT